MKVGDRGGYGEDRVEKERKGRRGDLWKTDERKKGDKEMLKSRKKRQIQREIFGKRKT